MRELRRLDAWINDISMRSLDNRILIQRIREPKAQMEITYAQRMGIAGERMLGRRRQSKTIWIEWQIRERFDLAARSRIVDAVNAWAKNGRLQISSRPDQRIEIVCVGHATMEQVKEYTDTYSLELRAVASPYWEDERAETITMSGTQGTGTIINGGSMEAYPEVAVTPTGGTLGNITLLAGDTAFTFSGLNIAQGTTMRIYHDQRGDLVMEAGGNSLMGYRTPVSADELICKPGTNDAGFVANVACNVAMSVRGRWI